MPNIDTYNACKDLPDSRDITSEQLFGILAVASLPKKVIHDKTPPLDQGNRGACTVFGSSGALFETMAQNLYKNTLDYTQPYDPWTVWNVALTKGASDTGGWYIQSALQLITDMRCSLGYTLIGDNSSADLYTMKYWIKEGRSITTGTQYGDWSKITQTGEYSESSRIAGHCFQFSSYDDDHTFKNGEKGGFYCPNSWRGVASFWMPYSMIGQLFSQYIQLGTEDIEALKRIKNERNTNYSYLAQTRGIWSGERPNTLATADEIVLMLERSTDSYLPKTREYWATLIDSRILRGKDKIQLWNKKDAKKLATNIEVAIMFTRAVKRDATLSRLVLARIQVAMVCGRDFL